MEPIYNIKPLLNTGINPSVRPLQTGVSGAGYVNASLMQTSGVNFVEASPFTLNEIQIKALAENNPRIMQLMDDMNVWKYS